VADPLEGDLYRQLEFDKSARPVRPEQVAEIAPLAGRVTDLVVLAHGWNNDVGSARRQYSALLTSVGQQRDAGLEPGLDGRAVGVLGVVWPSKEFGEAELVPGGAAGLGDADPTLAADLVARADAFAAPDAREKLERAAALVPRLRHSPAARRQYADLLRSLVDPRAGDDEDAGPAFFALDGTELYQRVDDPTLGDPDLIQPGSPGTAGGALGVPAAGALADPTGGAANVFSDLVSAGRNLLNLTTYYEMKDRAGKVGEALGPLLVQHAIGRTRVHLVGHSFGARLLSAAAADAPQDGIASMSLLQAAFSHYGFAKDWEPGKDGAYRGVLIGRKLSGPMIVTHTRNDRAVGIAYAIASRVAGQVASSIGDADSRFGGLGGNGAQRTPEVEASRMLDVGLPYRLAGGRVYNLLADEFVTGHSDVTDRPVAHAVLAAVAAGG
jgi:pimeloyl-ACP methyl ester carboxylesterase